MQDGTKYSLIHQNMTSEQQINVIRHYYPNIQLLMGLYLLAVLIFSIFNSLVKRLFTHVSRKEANSIIEADVTLGAPPLSQAE
jgi:hypothetical protein